MYAPTALGQTKANRETETEKVIELAHNQNGCYIACTSHFPMSANHSSHTTPLHSALNEASQVAREEGVKHGVQIGVLWPKQISRLRQCGLPEGGQDMQWGQNMLECLMCLELKEVEGS